MEWQNVAREKFDSIYQSIPKEWRLQLPIPPPEDQPDVTGKFITRHLTEREIEITESDALDIVRRASNGTWSAKEITRAFCHRASLAHQLVIFGTGAIWKISSSLLPADQLPP